MNKDESLKCVSLSKQKLGMGDMDGAMKYAEKAVRMDSNTVTMDWFNHLQSRTNTTNTEAHTNDTKEEDTSGIRHRRKKNGGEGDTHPTPSHSRTRSKSPSHKPTKSKSSSTKQPSSNQKEEEKPNIPYTSKHVQGITRILECHRKGDLYGVLGVDKECGDIDIKKSYRKLALMYHPDKCGAPGTDDAFKAIGHAFTVLGTSESRDRYNMYGVTDNRAGGTGNMGGMRGFRGFGGDRFETEMTPEDVFRMFFMGDDAVFGGGMGHGGSPFVFGGGGPGFRARMYRGQGHPGQQRRRQAESDSDDDDARGGAVPGLVQCIQVLPIIVLCVVTIMSLVSQILDTSSSHGLENVFRMNRAYGYETEKVTRVNGVRYWVNDGVYGTRVGSDMDKRDMLDRLVEHQVVTNLQYTCSREQELKKQRTSQSYGLFGVNKELLKKAEMMRMPSCERLAGWKWNGYKRR